MSNGGSNNTEGATATLLHEDERPAMDRCGKEKEHEENLIDNEFDVPEGGFGWVIVVVAFFVQFFLLGTMNNFAILYIELLKDFKSSRQETSWVGSITYGIMFLSGPVATSLCQKMGCRPVAIMGGLIGAIGTLLASYSNTIVKMYLTEGVLFGVGASLCYFPSIIILPQYFKKRWSLVTGLVTCGSGVGTMAMAPIINVIVERYGWRKAVRISSVQMVMVSFISLLYKPRLPKNMEMEEESKKRPMFDTNILKNKAFIAFVAALFVFMLSYQVPFVHLAQMATEYGIPRGQAVLLIGIISVFSTVGRLFFGHVADSPRINRLYMYQIAFLAIGVANTLCTVLKTFPALLIYCLLFGFFEGCYVCQVAILTGDIVGPESMASAVGLVFGIKSIPLTLGAPIAGALYDVSNSYQVAFLVAGAMPVITSCIMFTIPYLMPQEELYCHEVVCTEGNTITSSDQKLIRSASQESLHEKADFNHSKEVISTMHLSPLTAMNKRQLKRPSIISMHHLHHNDIEKKISMRNLGSLSSFGSMILSPSSRKNSTLLDHRAPGNEHHRPHARTLGSSLDDRHISTLDDVQRATVSKNDVTTLSKNDVSAF